MIAWKLVCLYTQSQHFGKRPSMQGYGCQTCVQVRPLAVNYTVIIVEI